MDRAAAGVMFTAPDGAVLLVRRSKNASDHQGEWAFPGGGIEAGESAEDAARREAVEEVGSHPHGELVELMRSVRDGVDFTTFMQRVPERFDPQLNEESDEFAWVDPSVAVRQDAAKSSKTDARYVDVSNKNEKCRDCTMFREPDGCTAVEGKIDPDGWCRFFERQNNNSAGGADSRYDADFDESEHPRDPDGKFTEGSGAAGLRESASTKKRATSASTKKRATLLPHARLFETTGHFTKEERKSLHALRDPENELASENLATKFRTGKPLSPQERQVVAHLDSMIMRSRLKEDTTVYRGLSLPLSKIKDFISDPRGGHNIENSNYSFVSLSDDGTAEGFAEGTMGGHPTVLVSKIAAGSAALYSEDLDPGGLEAAEAILPRETWYRVRGKPELKKGIYYIPCVAITPKKNPSIRADWSPVLQKLQDLGCV